MHSGLVLAFCIIELPKEVAYRRSGAFRDMNEDEFIPIRDNDVTFLTSIYNRISTSLQYLLKLLSTGKKMRP
jgi:hypothetical protein